MPPASKIIELRELLAAKHPASAPKIGGFLPTGVSQVDAVLRGGLPLGGLTEIVCAAGGGLLLSELVRATLRRRGLMALIDAADAFDPTGLPAAALQRLLWVRSQSVMQANQAADLLLRDGNLSLVVLDLRAVPAEQVRRVPAMNWYRLQRAVEPTPTAFAVLTRLPLIAAARPRVRVDARFSLDACERLQTDLLRSLHAERLHGQEQEEPSRERQFA